MKIIGKRLRILFRSRYFKLVSVLSVFILLIVVKQDNLFLSQSDLKSFGLKKPLQQSPKLNVPFQEANQVKILCYILLSQSKLRTALLIKETWGSHCDEILFFGGYENPILPVTYLNISEGYENLWGKAKAALLYLSRDARFKNFQYFLKADDDTFVIVENLRKFIQDSTIIYSKPSWFGFKLKHKRMPQGYMSGGAGYVFNYIALEKVTEILTGLSPTVDLDNRTCDISGEYGVEDLELGKCFHAAGVESVSTIDKEGGERFLPLPYETLLNGAISSYHWIWSQAWNRIKTGEKCCSQELISMHEISPSQMKLMYNLIYKLKVWKVDTA